MLPKTKRFIHALRKERSFLGRHAASELNVKGSLVRRQVAGIHRQYRKSVSNYKSAMVRTHTPQGQHIPAPMTKKKLYGR